MNRLFLLFAFTLLAIPAFAGTKIVSGSLSELKGVKTIPITVKWDNALYGKSGTLDDFLAKAERNKDWESESLDYLYRKTNYYTGEYGIRLVGDYTTLINSEYYFEMEVATISKGGEITGEILLKKKGQEEPVATIAYKSDDDDDDDKIAFRDQFKSIGENLGKLIVKQIK
ncbi:MAG: hypothetical protein NC082_03125 [Clostridiales bacterium]|nr:hypothetical protein [Clostridiales bacterium]